MLLTSFSLSFLISKVGETFLHSWPAPHAVVVRLRGTHACGHALYTGGLQAHSNWGRVISTATESRPEPCVQRYTGSIAGNSESADSPGNHPSHMGSSILMFYDTDAKCSQVPSLLLICEVVWT